jgi:nitrite reductase/ring-hydroxylating ferredoxin subunit
MALLGPQFQRRSRIGSLVARPGAFYSRDPFEKEPSSMSEFVRVAGTGEIPPGTIKLVTVGSERIGVANVDGAFHAFSDECTHDGGPLSEGDLEGAIVTCPWHFSRFDVRTGEIVESPAEEVIQVFEVRIEDDAVFVGPARPAA